LLPSVPFKAMLERDEEVFPPPQPPGTTMPTPSATTETARTIL